MAPTVTWAKNGLCFKNWIFYKTLILFGLNSHPVFGSIMHLAVDNTYLLETKVPAQKKKSINPWPLIRFNLHIQGYFIFITGQPPNILLSGSVGTLFVSVPHLQAKTYFILESQTKLEFSNFWYFPPPPAPAPIPYLVYKNFYIVFLIWTDFLL